MGKLRQRLSFANVMSVIAVFIALGGTGYAAFKQPKNSVGTKQLKKNAVIGAKVKDRSLTGRDIDLEKLGTVPAATHAASADSASAIPPPEATHLVGTPGEPPFQDAKNFSSGGGAPETGFTPVGFYKDHEGTVHLSGEATLPKGSGVIFTLPPGFRPASHSFESFEPRHEAVVVVIGSEENLEKVGPGAVFGYSELISLSGITFRAGS